jgi:hypothetical protein
MPSRGANRRPSKGRDHALNSYYWTHTVRRHWQARREPCRRCGQPIDYDSPRYWPGTRRVNPTTLAVGHVIGRHEARALGWSEERINAITNTQPEHARCSDSSGATYGNALRKPPTHHSTRYETDDW